MATKKKTKKVASKSKKVSKAKVVRVKSKIKPKLFQIVKEKKPFLTYKITSQTIYWGILLVYIMLLSFWILNIQIDTLKIINQISSF